MPTLEPVDYDPFAGLQPVDYDPWNGRPMPSTYEESRMDAAQRRLEPVDHDPFSSAPAPSSRAQEKFNKIADAFVAGAKNTIETPGRAMREGITTDQAVDWAAPTALGMVAGARLPGGAPEGALGSSGAKLVQPEGIRAYHGSPHDFDRFDLSKIGTGEGAQAYGHGLYFAEAEPVARQYRDTLAPSRSKLPDDVVSMPMDSRRSFMAQVATDADPLTAAKRAQYGASALRAEDVNKLAGLISDVRQARQGRMYEVNIGAKPEQFLDWDKPLSQQPDVVKTLVGGAKHPEDWVPNSDFTGAKYWAETQGGPSDRSAFMRERGIPGIRYLDQGSRTNVNTNELRGSISMFERALAKHPGDEMLARELASAKEQLAMAERGATSNYVVFDPGIIDILRKYGLAGGAALGAASLPDQDQSQ